MKIRLNKPFNSNSPVDESDVKQMKKALNRIGYYQPYEKVGITGVPDSAVFSALKAFQKDFDLPVTGSAKPDDDTIQALNREILKTPFGTYIWRTVDDEKVRTEHAAFNRTIRRWDDAPDPGEDFNCRCWVEPMAALPLETNCDEEREKYEELQASVKELSERFHDFLLKLNKLREEHNGLIENARKALGAQIVSYILSLPFERLGFLSELLSRYFGNIINNELLQAADNFMQQVWAIKQKIQYFKDQRDIVFAQLERAAKGLEEAKKKLEECENNEEKSRRDNSI